MSAPSYAPRMPLAFDDIILSPGCADLYNEKVIRSTQGALFHMNCVQEDLHAAIARLRAQGASIYATAPAP